MATERTLLSPITESVIPGTRRVFSEFGFNEAIKRAPIIVVTDLEGPQVLGDTAAEVMKGSIRYGDVIFNEVYDWYTARTQSRRKNHKQVVYNNLGLAQGTNLLRAQEGTDITFALPLLISAGVTQSDINNVARGYKQTPGGKQFIQELKEKGAVLIAVTTAWQEPSQIITNEIGIDYVVGTPFPIDETRDLLIRTGNFGKEMRPTEMFISDCQEIIEAIENSDEEDRVFLKQKLYERVGRYYEKELGISYDPSVLRQRKERGTKCPTLTGQIIEEIGVVGDRAKAATASYILKNSNPNAVIIVTGDGLNDIVMLEKCGNSFKRRNAISVGLNGPEAALFGDINLLTTDVSVYIKIVDVLRQNGHSDLNETTGLIKGRLSNNGTVVYKRDEVTDAVVLENKKMKKALRGIVIP